MRPRETVMTVMTVECSSESDVLSRQVVTIVVRAACCILTFLQFAVRQKSI